MQRKKILGSFYTPKVLADWMVERVLSKGAFVSVLEPSCGDGVFISSLLSKNKRLNITAIDIDSEAIKHVCSISPHITIRNSDFLTYKTQKKFNLIIGNPPYIAKKNLPKEQIDECKFIHTSNGLQNREISNIWTAFVVKSNELLDSKGTLALVLPAEFLQVKYAEEIRNFIADNFARVEILSFRNFRFDNTEQNTIILFAYKATLESKGIFFKEINSISELCDKIVFHKSTLEPKMKWTANCLTNDELSLIQKILKNDCVKPIDYYCTSVAGIVTAANSYFIISKNTVTEYNLKNYIKPIIKKGFFVNKKVCFKENDFQKLEDANNPCFLLSLENIKEYEFNKGLKKYLQHGIDLNINKRYKCTKRNRWYDVPSIWNSEGFFFKRSDKYPKIVVNECNVYVTDSAYRIKMKKEYSMKNLTYSFYNTFTLLMAEILGRSYGGGVLELTPNEFKSIPVIYYDEAIDFDGFADDFYKKENIVEILNKNDNNILKRRLNLTTDELMILRSAYETIKKRRIL